MHFYQAFIILSIIIMVNKETCNTNNSTIEPKCLAYPSPNLIFHYLKPIVISHFV